MECEQLIEYSSEALNESEMVVTPETIRHWKEVGARIREIRQLKGKAIKDIAVESDTLKSAICHFERGICSTSINYALFLRNEYGISFDWIYDGEIIDRIYRDVIEKREFDPVEIGNRIKEIRKNKDMTQENFGHLVGLSSVGVGNIENGNRKPRIETALKMKKTLQRPLDWIYFGDEIILPKSAERLKKLFCF